MRWWSDSSKKSGQILGTRSSLNRRDEDFDPIDHLAYALHARGELLGDLLEVVGGERAVEMDDTVTDSARDRADRQITALPEPFLGLAMDLRVFERSGAR